MVQVNIRGEPDADGEIVYIATVPTTPPQDVQSYNRAAVEAAAVARCTEQLGDGDVQFVEV